MASISSVGVGSGVLNNDLIDQLIEAERAPTDKRLDVEKVDLETKISELGNIKSAVSSLQSTVSSLTLASSFETNTTSSSDSTKLTATASSLASPGVYNIETTQLARSQTIASKTYENLNDVVGQGKLVFKFGEVETTLNADKSVDTFGSFTEDPSQPSKSITINSGNHTLAGVRDAVNSADIGIRASIVDTGDGFRLLFESEDTGKSNGFTIETQNANNGLDDFEFNETNFDNVLHATNAVDAELKVNGLEITRESNQIAGVINGVTLNLRQTSVGEPVTLTVEADMETINKRMQDFVTSYNELKTLTNDLTAYNLEEQEGSVFTGDPTVRNLENQLKRILSSALPTGAGGSLSSLAEIGIKTNEKTGLISFDSTEFANYARNEPEALTKLFGTTGVGADNVEYIRGNNQTKSGDYDVVVTELATQGEFKGNATSGGPYIINALNDTFTINVDGVNSEQIELNQSPGLSGTELANLLQTQINADEKLKANAKSVSVEFDSSNNSFNITSASFGSKSSVSFNSIDSNMAQDLGLYRPGQGPRTLDLSDALRTTPELQSAVVIDDSNDNFTLSVGGTSSAEISIAQGSYSDGEALASAIQSAINADSAISQQGLSATVSYNGEQDGGQFNISFNNQESFQVLSADAALSDIGITANVSSTSKVSGLASNDQLAASLTVDANNDTFSLSLNGKSYEDIEIAQGSYTTGQALATAVQDAINAQTSTGEAAKTAAGSVDLSTLIDFTSEEYGFKLSVNGDPAVDVVVDQNAGTMNLESIQAALDTALGGTGIVTASLDNGNLVLEGSTIGEAGTIEVINDGRVASTNAGTVDTTTIPGATSFAAAEIEFSLNGDSFTLDLSSLSDPLSLPADINTLLNDQLTAHADFSAGDIVAKLDASNQLYFEGNTAAASEALSISSTTNDVFGVDGVASTAGANGFGLAESTSTGLDGSNATVSFVGGNGEGGLRIAFDNEDIFRITAAEENMANTLGIAASDGSETQVTKGKDVVGTINGVAAVGSGQRLTGAEGNDAYGLALNISGDAIGKRGTVNFNLGLAEQTERFLQAALSATGFLTEKESGLQASLKDIAEEKAELETRMESRRTSLSRQFTYYDTIVAQLNSSLDFIKANFEALNAQNN
ncbi:flagellar filament capping protein FliD [uncultured Pseudoteredinibacter sp.]|uniref:flagellar filament capping protein FliD n=1 Tax=uncultured Pseudoteredinibacter sp. TaxID=1641701 RepID=UPI002623FC36|nr:flagellar filament capping protein FliD [uncultured Pseudoteredinibacter sp.]